MIPVLEARGRLALSGPRMSQHVLLFFQARIVKFSNGCDIIVMAPSDAPVKRNGRKP